MLGSILDLRVNTNWHLGIGMEFVLAENYDGFNTIFEFHYALLVEAQIANTFCSLTIFLAALKTFVFVN